LWEGHHWIFAQLNQATASAALRYLRIKSVFCLSSISVSTNYNTVGCLNKTAELTESVWQNLSRQTLLNPVWDSFFGKSCDNLGSNVTGGSKPGPQIPSQMPRSTR